MRGFGCGLELLELLVRAGAVFACGCVPAACVRGLRACGCGVCVRALAVQLTTVYSFCDGHSEDV